MALVETVTIVDGSTATLRQIDSALDATAQRVTRLSSTTVVSSRATQAAVRNLGFQLNDVATSLASGSSPFQVLAQQAGQFQVAFAQGGGVNATLGAFASQLRALVTPATAAAAVGVAMAGGLALVTLRAREAAREVEVYNRIVATTGRGSPTSISAIQAENARLASSGVGASDASAMRLQIARSSTFNASQSSRLMETAASVGAILGTDAVAGLDRLEQAAKGGAEGMAKLALDVGAVSREAAQLAIDAGSGADGFEKMSQMASALERHLDGYAARNVDPIAKAATELSTSWSALLVNFGNTAGIEGIVVGALSGISWWLEQTATRIQQVKNLLSGNWSAFGPAVQESPVFTFPIPGADRPIPGVPAPKPTPPGTQSIFLPPVKVTATPRGGGGGSGGSSRAVVDPNHGLVDFSGGGEEEADLRAETAQLEKQLALVQQETALQGQSAEHIEYQLSLLKARQEVEKSGLDTTNATAASYLKSAEALAASRLHLEQSRNKSRRWEDAIRSVASTVENTLGNTMEDIFSGRKITDWGAQLKSVVGSVLSDIVKFTLIRPAIGQPLGFGEIGQFGELS